MIQKQSVNINFAKGLDTKTDKFQVQLGNFLKLDNSIFTKGGLLQKRNGFKQVASLPDTTSTYATTFNGDLTAVGNTIQAYSKGSVSWINQGYIQPLELTTQSLIRSNLNQTQADSAISLNGLVCTVFTDQNPSSLGSVVYKYVISDATTGQNIIAPTLIPVTTGTITGSPRIFLLGYYFIIVFNNVITATNTLQYISISTANPHLVTTNTTISSNYTPSSGSAFNGFVANGSLYLAWNGSDIGGAIRVTYLDSTLNLHGVSIFAGRKATIISVTADITGSTPVIYVSFYDSVSSTGYVLSVNQIIATVLAPTQWLASGTVANVTACAQNGSVNIFYEITNSYSYDGTLPTNYIETVSVSQAGTVGSSSVVVRSVGLASKAFIDQGIEYFLVLYTSAYQPTYFLITGTGNIVAKVAYQNGDGYLTKGLPSVSYYNGSYSIPYLYKDLIQAVNKNTNVPAGSQVNGIYSQTGINLVTFKISTSNIISAEIATNLHLTGGFMWMYDGYYPTEHGFFLYPDNVYATWSTTGGSIAAKPDGSTNTNAYYYQVTYEWSDNQGNIHRSSPSIPISVSTTGNGNTGSITINVPTLRLTYKTANPVKIVIYRWSVAQQTYYQVTSLTSPVLNNPSVDSITYVDTLADASILGNNIIYTNGGVLENIGAPACSALTLFDNRLWLLDSEDGTLWFSKIVIPTVPVEMSDLQTIYVAPTIGSNGSTGKVKAMYPMDDKIILFKKDAIYYINGVGPDATGANSQYSQPIYITGTVGCDNQHSIVLTPNGLMFQSDKGIWILDRNLATQYIGAPVEDYNSQLVDSAVVIPGTNQVRFTLSNSNVLMYDYYFGQWGTFSGIPSISSTLYEGLHTFINKYGEAYQENPNVYTDGGNPVLLSFTTSWVNLAGLQGYERVYFFYLLGKYLTPHKLQVAIAYDYDQSPTQLTTIEPYNYNAAYGDDSPYGQGSPYGGNTSVEQWQVFMQRQTCESFQLSLSEIFDPRFGTSAGAGLTLSGLNFVVGVKKGFNPVRRNSTG